MTKYDDASWHLDGDSPAGMTVEMASTHPGMFLCWAVDRGLESPLLRKHFRHELDDLKKRRMTGGEFLIRCCDGKLTNDDLNDLGTAFADSYYATDAYIDDYADVFGNVVESLYDVEDNWDNFKLISDVLDKRFSAWQSER